MQNKKEHFRIITDVEEILSEIRKCGDCGVEIEFRPLELTEQEKKDRVLRFDMLINPK